MGSALSTDNPDGEAWPSIRIRSSLYVPGTRPDRFDKAVTSGADSIILDLEDSVAPDAKNDARSNVAAWLASHDGARAWVRVNNDADHRGNSGLLARDLAMVTESRASANGGALGVVLPKATPEVCSAIDLPTIALIESGRGIATATELARLPSVVRLGLGEADLAADLGMDPSTDGHEMFPLRSMVVVASAAADLIAPAGPVHTAIDDDEGLRDSSEQLRRQGFGGRSVIHPRQVAAVHGAFSPSPDAVASARAIIDAADRAAADGLAVAVHDGEFIDAAGLRRARSTIAAADDS